MTSPRLTAEPRGWVLEAVERHEASLVVYAARLLGDPDGARDVVQETFLRLCRQDRDRVEPHLAEWLFTVCRNRSLDILRRRGRMTSLADDHAETVATDDPAPPDSLERDEDTALVHQMLGALPASQQEVIRLRFQNGFSYNEISRITGHSVTNVGYLLHAAMKTLRSRVTALHARASHPSPFSADGNHSPSLSPRPQAQF